MTNVPDPKPHHPPRTHHPSTPQGSELFTGNTAVVGASFFEGKVSRQQLARSWGVSYLGNLFGCSLLALLCNYAGVFSQAAGTFTAVADAKASLPFGVAVARGVRA
jgi:formate/nitrite transporter FocA (FNT family)